MLLTIKKTLGVFTESHGFTYHKPKLFMSQPISLFTSSELYIRQANFCKIIYLYNMCWIIYHCATFQSIHNQCCLPCFPAQWLIPHWKPECWIRISLLHLTNLFQDFFPSVLGSQIHLHPQCHVCLSSTNVNSLGWIFQDINQIWHYFKKKCLAAFQYM